MSEDYVYEDYDDDPGDDDGDDWLGFTEEDCGRWINGKLLSSYYCRLAGTEDCDWECPLRSRPPHGE